MILLNVEMGGARGGGGGTDLKEPADRVDHTVKP